jgi:hypothetical protein
MSKAVDKTTNAADSYEEYMERVERRGISMPGRYSPTDEVEGGEDSAPRGSSTPSEDQAVKVEDKSLSIEVIQEGRVLIRDFDWLPSLPTFFRDFFRPFII